MWQFCTGPSQPSGLSSMSLPQRGPPGLLILIQRAYLYLLKVVWSLLLSCIKLSIFFTVLVRTWNELSDWFTCLWPLLKQQESSMSFFVLSHCTWMFINERMKLQTAAATGRRTVPVPVTFREKLSHMVFTFLADKMRAATFPRPLEAVSGTEYIPELCSLDKRDSGVQLIIFLIQRLTIQLRDSFSHSLKLCHFNGG